MEKYKSLYAYFDGDAWEAAKYAFLPLLPYHTWWSSVWIDGVKSSFGRGADFLEERGFLRHDRATSYPIAYIGDEEGEEKTIPPENDEALSAIAATCEENGIALVFFKAPVAKWTRAESKVVKAYMAEHGYTYLELNDHLDEIGIAPETDFYNELHLNTSGANKTTDFLANYLKERF